MWQPQKLQALARRWFMDWRRRNRARRQRLLARSTSHARFRLTREGFHLLLVVLFIFIGAVLREINLLILLAAAMIGLLLLQWRFDIGTISGLTATRRLAERISEGTEVECTVTVENPKRWLGAWLVTVEDGIHQLAPHARRAVGKGVAVVDEVPPRGRSAASYRLVFRERGRYRVGPSVISTRFPLNLGRGWRNTQLTQEIMVHPRLGELTAAAQGLFHSNREGTAKSARHAGSHETEFFGLRPWAMGDSRRWIHWRTSAKLGELSVRQFERLQRQQACLLLELYLAKGDRSDASLQACERAIAFVATMAMRVAKTSGTRLSIAIAGRQSITMTSVQSPVLVRHLLDELAMIGPTHRPDRGAALERMATALMANPNLLVVSTREQQLSQLQTDFQKSLGARAGTRLNIQWLNASRTDLDPYFAWNPSISSGYAIG